MSPESPQKTALILLAMGGPGNLDDIPEFLYNIFSDRSIIRLPGGSLFQKSFAKLISRLRSSKVADHYKLIGGSSPLLKWTSLQADRIRDILSKQQIEISTYIGMRYLPPYTKTAIEDAYNDGCRHFIFLPMYPQFSKATTGSSFQKAHEALGNLPDGIKMTFINDFHDNEGYTTLLAKNISKNINEKDTLLFSAHSLPQKFVDEGDPYVDQTKKTVSLAANGREYNLSFQSRTGPVTWVGPDTIAETRRLLSETKNDLFIVPISFVCDHIETQYEIDIELKGLMPEKDRDRIKRMPMFNDDHEFSKILADLVKTKLSTGIES